MQGLIHPCLCRHQRQLWKICLPGLMKIRRLLQLAVLLLLLLMMVSLGSSRQQIAMVNQVLTSMLPVHAWLLPCPRAGDPDWVQGLAQ
jgi:hypothetical protein